MHRNFGLTHFFYNFFAVTKFILEDKPQLCDKFLLSLHVKSDFK